MLTWQDSVERLIDYLGAGQSDVVLRDCKQATIEALRELVQAHTWTYLYKHGRIVFDQCYTQGLINYTNVGDYGPHEISLTGGVWPSWAVQGTLRIFDINFDVSSVLNPTTLFLAPPQLPTSDFVAQAYGLFHDTYSLPDDFIMHDISVQPTNFGDLKYVHPREWLWNVSANGVSGDPVIFTIMSDPDRPQGLAVKFAPFPTTNQVVEYLYKRKSNRLQVFKESSGTISVNHTYPDHITGIGTNFTPLMVNNAVLRIGGDPNPKNLPTSLIGTNPAVFESKITSVADATHLTVWDPVPTPYANMPFTISSYIDIETGAMEQAYLRCCEMIIGMSRTLKDKPSARLQYNAALDVARCADSRNNMARVAGPPQSVRRRLKDYPIDLTREL